MTQLSPELPDSAAGGGLSLHDLLMSLDELAPLLPDALRRGDSLNAYLLGAAMNQIAEDYLHHDTLFLGAAGDHLLAEGGRARQVAGRGVWSAASVVQKARSRNRASRSLLRWQRALAAFVETLAAVVVEDAAPGTARADVIEIAERTASSVAALPDSLRHEVLRLPSCFQAFDLEPADVRELADRFSRSWPSRARSLLVVGVRTSGSYLAPLCAAFLRADGYRDVRVLTLRPQHQLFAHERAAARGVARLGGLSLIIDDPPGSGRSVARVASELRGLSLPESSIVLLLPVFGRPEALPPVLRPYPSVLLAADDWAIQSRLTPQAVRGALTRLLASDAHVGEVRLLPMAARRPRRGHERALFDVDLIDRRATRTTPILVHGVGVGYYALHAEAVARALAGRIPDVYGVDQGRLFREWLPDEQRAAAHDPSENEALADAVASYVVARRRALPVTHDSALGLTGQRPAWEVASQVLSRVFGRAGRVAGLLFVDSLSKRILRVAQPSVIDGWTPLSNWFADERARGGYVKTGFVERSFWNLGLNCYDAVFDLAGAAVSCSEPATADRLRSAYERLSGESVGDERWLLYELAQLWGNERAGTTDAGELQRARSQAVQRYFARAFLADLEPSADGPLCAIDLDGVLETQALGFPATSAAGARALRALIAHGYRPIVVTGRSAGEVADRCVEYRLEGGVAEYGAVVYTTASRRAHVLLSDADRRVLARLADSLAGIEGVFRDPAHQQAVRAFRIDRLGRRQGLDERSVDAGLATVEDRDRIRTFAGATQTDFMVVGVDKGTGVQALVDRLGGRFDGGQKLLAFAVGDAAADLPMLNLATLACAPSNADVSVRRAASVHVLKAPYQAGLAAAVARLVGHPPGSCAICRSPPLTSDAEALLAVISAHERGTFGLAHRFLQQTIRASR